MERLWTASVVGPWCLDCKAPPTRLLPRMSSASFTADFHGFDGAEWWCPSCDGQFIDQPRPAPTTLNVSLESKVVALPPRHEASWVARVEANGTVRLQVGRGEPLVIGSLEELRAWSSLFLWLGRGAQGARETLTGARRWLFSRDAMGRHATILGETRTLYAFQVGHAKRTQKCSACARPLHPGEAAYRPVVAAWESSSVGWKAKRFCSACVEDAVPARPFGALRSLPGGKGRAAG